MGKKGDATRQKILDSATHCFARYGDRGTTFQRIADHCGMSQPYVVKYFKSREEIFPRVLQAYLDKARERTEASLAAEGNATEKLQRYLVESFAIFIDDPLTSRIYNTLYYLAAVEDRYRQANTAIKEVAVRRIRAILELGSLSGEFKVADPGLAAKMIHNNLVGLLLNLATEQSKIPAKKLRDALIEATLRSVRPD